MFARIYHFLRGPNPLHPNVWTGRLAPITFRRLVPEDIPQCLELYVRNEKERFPQGVIGEYEKCLTEESCYFLVAEREGRIIASGGVSYSIRRDIAVFSFGLIHPDHQSKGIGTALVLARLALLNPDCFSYHVLIFAVEKSIGFYQRFGFESYRRWKDSQGQDHPSGHLLIMSSEIRRCRHLLEAHGVVVPPDQDRVPFRPQWVIRQTATAPVEPK